MARKLKRFFQNIRRGLIWFRRGYYSYEWDFGPLLSVMLWKLEDMKGFWANPDNVHIIEKSRLRNLRNISICCFLLRRIREDDYMEICGYDTMKHIGMRSEPCKDREGYSTLELYYIGAETEKEKEAAEKKYKRVVKKAKAIQEYDIQLFFKIFQRHFQEWWD